MRCRCQPVSTDLASLRSFSSLRCVPLRTWHTPASATAAASPSTSITPAARAHPSACSATGQCVDGEPNTAAQRSAQRSSSRPMSKSLGDSTRAAGPVPTGSPTDREAGGSKQADGPVRDRAASYSNSPPAGVPRRTCKFHAKKILGTGARAVQGNRRSFSCSARHWRRRGRNRLDVRPR
jgi:hypothetical protein